MEPVSLRMAAATFALLAASMAHAADANSLAARALSTEELSEVHAGGLAEDFAMQIHTSTLRAQSADGHHDDLAMREQAALVERQQVLAQLRLATGATQGMVNLTQTVAFAGAFTPVAPLLIPVMMPFPFVPLPPQNSGKHGAGHL